MSIAASKSPPMVTDRVRVPLLCSIQRDGEVGAGHAPHRVGRGVDYRQVRASIAAVLDLAGYAARVRVGDQLRGPCPMHRSATRRSRSFSVNLDKNIYRCFVCGSSGNQLDLWMKLTEQSLYAATLDLCQRLHIKAPFLPWPAAPRRSTQSSREEEPVIDR